jgi:hypothetical protein
LIHRSAAIRAGREEWKLFYEAGLMHEMFIKKQASRRIQSDTLLKPASKRGVTSYLFD